MTNSQSAHDVSAYDDDDGYGEIGVYARRTGTAPGETYTWTSSFCACDVLPLYLRVVDTYQYVRKSGQVIFWLCHGDSVSILMIMVF